MFKLINEVYQIYADDGEMHKIRLISSLGLAVAVALVSQDLAQDAYPAIALTLSVLVGFTFTALFSGHIITTSELPKPENETDRNDITRLKKLGENFRVRSRYFIILSIFVLFFIVVLSVKINHKYIVSIIQNFEIDVSRMLFEFYELSIIFVSIGFLAGSFIVFLFFLECLYTFYRLAETAMSITDTRRDYISAHS